MGKNPKNIDTTGKAYLAGFKLGSNLRRKEIKADEKFEKKLERISDNKGKIDWENRNPFKGELKNIFESYAEGQAELNEWAREQGKKAREKWGGATTEEFLAGFESVTGTKIGERREIDFGGIASNLQRNFYEHYVEKSRRRENAEIPDSLETQTELFTHLLQNNDGVALGDNHGQNEMMRFLADKLELAKQLGVDTIYFESTSEEMADLMASSEAELQNVIDNIDPRAVKDELNKFYQITNGEDSMTAFVKLLKEAKHLGIEIKGIDDKIGPEVKPDQKMDFRGAVTNFEWVHNIEQDRKGKDGKYLVFGGLAHFANIKGPTNGLVDDALGIPLLSYTYSKTEDWGFHKARNDWGGVDYWLHGGPDFKAVNKDGVEVIPERDMIEEPFDIEDFFEKRRSFDIEDFFEMSFDPTNLPEINGNGVNR